MEWGFISLISVSQYQGPACGLQGKLGGALTSLGQIEEKDVDPAKDWMFTQVISLQCAESR